MGALFARGGHASLMGNEQFISRAGYGDHCAGLAILSATLSALFLRQQTGKGTVVSTSLQTAGEVERPASRLLHPALVLPEEIGPKRTAVRLRTTRTWAAVAAAVSRTACAVHWRLSSLTAAMLTAGCLDLAAATVVVVPGSWTLR